MNGALLLAMPIALLVSAAHASDASDPPLLSPGPAASGAADRYGALVPDYAKLQTGGFLGMFTVGLGWSAFSDHFDVGATYGYAPPNNGGTHVHLFTGICVIRPVWFEVAHKQIRVHPIYVGGGVLVARGPDVFVRQPDVYPPGYYPPTGLHALVLVGSEVGLRVGQPGLIQRHSLYVEFVSFDQYLGALTDNRQFRLYDAFSAALGYRASF